MQRETSRSSTYVTGEGEKKETEREKKLKERRNRERMRMLKPLEVCRMGGGTKKTKVQ
jgi:hypothetical protein